MTVQVNKEDYQTRDYIMSRHYRTAIRKADEAGSFRRLHIELEEMAN